MKIHLRGDSANGTHTRFTVFINGANCGQLCMSDEDACGFYQIIEHSASFFDVDEFLGTGTWGKQEENDRKET